MQYMQYDIPELYAIGLRWANLNYEINRWGTMGKDEKSIKQRVGKRWRESVDKIKEYEIIGGRKKTIENLYRQLRSVWTIASTRKREN